MSSLYFIQDGRIQLLLISVVSRSEASLPKHSDYPGWHQIGFKGGQKHNWKTKGQETRPHNIPPGEPCFV